MRNVRFHPFLLALLLGLSAFGMGCRQSEEPESDRVAVEQDEQEQQDQMIADDPELEPEQRIVVVEPETGEDPGASQDLDERERRLAERQAQLDARERRLREAAERQESLREPERQARTTPRPAPPAQPRVEREEPVREETRRKPEPTEEVAESRRPEPRDDRDEEAEREAAELEEERRARAREAREERERQARAREAREREARERAEREAESRREEQARREREREEEEQARRPAPLVVNVPAGTVMEVELLEGLSSQTSEAGDIVRARVASDVATDGAVGIPAGSEIVGVVTEAVPLGKVGGRAKLGLKFTDLVLPSGRSVPIDATLVQQGTSERRKDAATIGGAAAGGAILGRVLSKKDRSRGAVIGAIIGAAAGAVIASRNGEELVIPEGTRLALKLDDEVEVRARQGR